jgi:hypothetical protein
VYSLAHLPRLVILLVAQPTGLRPLQDECPLKFCCGAQNVQQKARGGISLIRVQPLGNGNEANSVVFQNLDIIQAVDQ